MSHAHEGKDAPGHVEPTPRWLANLRVFGVSLVLIPATRETITGHRGSETQAKRPGETRKTQNPVETFANGWPTRWSGPAWPAMASKTIPNRCGHTRWLTYRFRVWIWKLDERSEMTAKARILKRRSSQTCTKHAWQKLANSRRATLRPMQRLDGAALVRGPRAGLGISGRR
jgi:hypothetical protein